jgi:hypothetical protein
MTKPTTSQGIKQLLALHNSGTPFTLDKTSTEDEKNKTQKPKILPYKPHG